MTEMIAAIPNFLRVFIAMAMSLGVVGWMPIGNGGAATLARQCGCSMCAGEPSCCVIPNEPAPAQQPAAPASRDSSEGQPLALADRLAVIIQLPDAVVIFPEVESVSCANLAGHSFQSVNCIWTV